MTNKTYCVILTARAIWTARLTDSIRIWIFSRRTLTDTLSTIIIKICSAPDSSIRTNSYASTISIICITSCTRVKAKSSLIETLRRTTSITISTLIILPVRTGCCSNLTSICYRIESVSRLARSTICYFLTTFQTRRRTLCTIFINGCIAWWTRLNTRVIEE